MSTAIETRIIDYLRVNRCTDTLFLTGRSDAIVGVTSPRHAGGPCVVYDRRKLIESVMKEKEKEGLTERDAEWYVRSQYEAMRVGSRCPVIVTGVEEL